jgi:hypothetical protein
MVAPNIFSIIIAVFPFIQKEYQFTCTEQNAPDNRKVHVILEIRIFILDADALQGLVTNLKPLISCIIVKRERDIEMLWHERT